MAYTFGSYSTEDLNTINTFEEIEDCSSSYFVAKEVNSVTLDNKEVHYNTVIELMDMEDATGEKLEHNRYCVTVHLVPTLNSLSKKEQEYILDSFEPEDRENAKQHPDRLVTDILTYGCGVPLESNTASTLEEAEQLVKVAKVVLPAIIGCVGFSLDKTINRLGNTGWDFLSTYCNDTNLLDLAKQRLDIK